jgi:hypothetical protein
MQAVCTGGSGINRGIYSYAGSGTTNHGVYGYAYGGTTAYGLYGHAYAYGGTLTAGAKSFKIDHPLDPKNQYLNHFCSESPEMLNIYSGNIMTGADGYATVKLPDYFDAINRDIRYQLTVVDSSDDFVQAKVASEVKDNQFIIRTSKPSVKVSWEVKGVRNDKWAVANATPVEQAKPADQIGKYLHPELYGEPNQSLVADAR